MTLEERAEDYVIYDSDVCFESQGFGDRSYIDNNAKEEIVKAYIIGANEQKEIDIDKVCKALWKYINQDTSFDVKNYDEGDTDEADDVFCYDKMADDIIKVVKKAMEE